MSITQRLLLFITISISTFLIIILSTFFYTNHNIDNFKNIQKKYLPISSINIRNLYLLEKIRDLFIDATITSEKDILLYTITSKKEIINNLKRAKEYGLDTKNLLKIFNEYFDFAYLFTSKVIQDTDNLNLDEAKVLQKYSNKVFDLFEGQKIHSSRVLDKLMVKIGEDNTTYFIYSLIISLIGLLILIFFALYLYRSTKYRFDNILLYLQNLTEEQPDFSLRIASSKNDEIGKIISLFNVLADKLEQMHTTSSEAFLHEIEETQKEVVFTMGAIGESRSKETGNHVKRVAEYSSLLALYYGLSEKDAEMLRQASPMHDIGKIAIPDAILNKAGRLDEEERKIMDKHVIYGYDMLKYSTRPLLKTASIVALEHHEKWDGTGYPNGLKEEEIHIFGRITAVADVFDALGSDRVYKKAWNDEEIFELFRNEKGKHFDPTLIDIFFDNLEKFLAIRDTFKD